VVFENIDIWEVFFREFKDCLERAMQKRGVLADLSAYQYGFLPAVIQAGFGNRNIEFAVQPRQNRLNAAAFLL